MAQPTQTKQKWSARRIVATALKLFVPVVVLFSTIAVVNFTVDPSRLYKLKRDEMLELQTVAYLREGRNVDGLSNYNERLVRRAYINEMTQPVEVVVAGSSRGALLTQEMMGAASMWNVSAAGGSLGDIVGYYGVLHDRGLLPERFVIVIDPWTLNDRYADKRYILSVGDGYYSQMTRMGFEVDESLQTIDPLFRSDAAPEMRFWDLERSIQMNLFSVPYFQAAIHRVFNPDAIVQTATPTDDPNGTYGMLRSDGSYSYPASYRINTIDQALMLAQNSLPHNIIGVENFSVLDGQNAEALRRLLAAARQDGVEVQLLLQPISPFLYDAMKEEATRYANVFASETLVYQIAADHETLITGTFDPHAIGIGMDAFYDGYHVKPYVLMDICAPLRESIEE